jgi:Alkylmercury lyase
MDETLHRAVTNSGIVIPPARQRTLSLPLRSLHRRILRHFADNAAAPAPQLLGEWAHDLDVSLDTALGQLVAADLVEIDPSVLARLLGAYPFSAIARGHTVQIDGGPTVQAYCAVDALGISSMLGRDVIVTSGDPQSGEPIRVVVTERQTVWHPDETVMVLGMGRSGEPFSHCCRCPYINFHTSAASAHGYLQGLDLTGPILTQAQALDLATFLFGDLLTECKEATLRGNPTD